MYGCCVLETYVPNIILETLRVASLSESAITIVINASLSVGSFSPGNCSRTNDNDEEYCVLKNASSGTPCWSLSSSSNHIRALVNW